MASDDLVSGALLGLIMGYGIWSPTTPVSDEFENAAENNALTPALACAELQLRAEEISSDLENFDIVIDSTKCAAAVSLVPK